MAAAENLPEPHETFLLKQDGSEKKIVMVTDVRIVNAATFTINKEDHTLGNLLATQLLQDPRVLYAGYKVPHPLENHIEIRIQVAPDYTPQAALQTAINDCISQIQQIGESFKASVAPFKESGQGEQDFI
eukprot:m.338556 g.338556  ORF g.338556 m.338556 type:complete len:130 (+) comp18460_c0_seq1:113-502(+)